MKLKLAFASLLCLTPFTFAHANPCDPSLNPDDMIHCAWVDGVGTSNLHDGRYIKEMSPNEGSITMCTNDGAQTYVQASYAEAGPDSVQYFICTDASGTSCSLIGVDNYTIFKSPVTGEYSATPKVTRLTLSQSLKDAYPTCNPFLRKS